MGNVSKYVYIYLLSDKWNSDRYEFYMSLGRVWVKMVPNEIDFIDRFPLHHIRDMIIGRCYTNE